MDFKYDDIKRMLPNPNEEQTTDDYYLTLANYLGKLWHQTGGLIPRCSCRRRDLALICQNVPTPLQSPRAVLR